MTQSYSTPDRHGYSVHFSPFRADHLLLASSQLFGLAGGGTLFLLQTHTQKASTESSTVDASAPTVKGLTKVCHFDWSDGLFDVAWCPYADNIAATASGDGSVQIWGGLDAEAETAALKATTKPLICLQGHQNEVYSIDWGEQWNHHHLLSSSWDGTLKVWDCNRQVALSTYTGHTDLIYNAKFSPLIANLFASALMRIDAGYSSELLTCDWSHFDCNILATGGSDGYIRAWDLRNMRHHIFELYSCDYAVRRLAFSPTAATVLATANYDFTTRIWDFKQSMEALEVLVNHSEFVCGLDWNNSRPHQLADCGWDAVSNVFTPQMLQQAG